MKEKLSLSVSLSLTLSGEHWTGAIQYQSKVMDRTSTPPLPTTRSLLHTSFPLTHSTSPIRFLPGLLTLSLSLSVYLSLPLWLLSLAHAVLTNSNQTVTLSLPPSCTSYTVKVWVMSGLYFTVSLFLFSKRETTIINNRERERRWEIRATFKAPPPHQTSRRHVKWNPLHTHTNTCCFCKRS